MEKFQDIWRDQCEAARTIRVRHGTLSALEYLIGEKLQTHAEAALTRPDFARELPRFVAEVRNIFSREEISHYRGDLERMTAEDEQLADDDGDEDFFRDPPERLAARRERLAQLRELLTTTVLGIG